jgi:murein L,D-transpeptidase YafK
MPEGRCHSFPLRQRGIVGDLDAFRRHGYAPPPMTRSWIALALVFAGPATAQSQPEVDFVRVDKSERTLTLYAGGQPVRTYTGIQLGDEPEGHKRFQGDERTPEGRYTLDYGNPSSAYHLSLHVSYPNAADRAYARAQGRSPGGDIFIHGQPNGFARTGGSRVEGDWTDGCIALADAEIEEVWSLVGDGTEIEIVP